MTPESHPTPRLRLSPGSPALQMRLSSMQVIHLAVVGLKREKNDRVWEIIHVEEVLLFSYVLKNIMLIFGLTHNAKNSLLGDGLVFFRPPRPLLVTLTSSGRQHFPACYIKVQTFRYMFTFHLFYLHPKIQAMNFPLVKN